MTASSPDLDSRRTTEPPQSTSRSASIISSLSLHGDIKEESEAVFRFLDLPLELRLKIYGYLLPPRHHKIALQPQNPPFFSNSLSVLSLSYPFGRSSASPSPSSSGTSTPTPTSTGARSPLQSIFSAPPIYKILTQNFRVAFPQPSIFPEILRVSRAVQSEAEDVLYGARGTVFDFGTSVEVVERFWSERSEQARACVREVRVARGVRGGAGNGGVEEGNRIGSGNVTGNENEDGNAKDSAATTDEKWDQACRYMKTELKNLRTLDLKFWSSDASADPFPLSLEDAALVGKVHQEGFLAAPPNPEDFTHEALQEKREAAEKKFQNWAWTGDLLEMESLRDVRVTWWTCADRAAAIDPWVAARFVSESFMRDKFVRMGVVAEAVMDLRFGKEERSGLI